MAYQNVTVVGIEPLSSCGHNHDHIEIQTDGGVGFVVFDMERLSVEDEDENNAERLIDGAELTSTASIETPKTPPPPPPPDQSVECRPFDIVATVEPRPTTSNEPPQPPVREGINVHRRVKKRQNACPYCKKMISNYSRHLVAVHADEDDVKLYIALENEPPAERKQKRKAITNRIRNIGNLAYNNEIVEGERRDCAFLPVKHSSHNRHAVSNTTHVTCKHCSGFYRKDSFYRHLARCEASHGHRRESKPPGRVLQDHSELLVKKNTHASGLLKDQVFPRMQRDEETLMVQSDSLISMYGSNFRFTHRGTNHVRYCSSRMRSLARLFITMREFKPELKSFRDCIAPQHFDTLVECVRQMSKFDSTEGNANSPSVAPRLCSSLKKCANIIKSNAIKDASLSRAERTSIMCEMNDFLHLMEKDWCTEVGSISDKSRKRKRVMKPDLLPDPEDIRTFSSYIHDLCPRYVESLEQIPNVSNYEQLAKLIIAHIISFNRRRPNETVEITLEAYRTTLNKRDDYGDDEHNVLTDEQRMSGDSLSIFYAPASKNLMKVPILLTKPFHNAVEVLIESRTKLGIQSKYLFARPCGLELFDGSAVLREFAKKAGLNKPTVFTANALRHHAATSSQLQTRNDTYTKSLSKFMGHDLRTHEHFYEMPLPLVQKSIVGHELLQMTLPKPSTSTSAIETLYPDTSSSGPTSDFTLSSTRGESSGGSQQQLASTSTDTINCEEDNSSEPSTVISSPPETPPKKKFKKHRWTFRERKSVYERFGHQFMLDLRPRRQEIKQFWEQEPTLKGRTLQQVVTYINNISTKKQQITTPIRNKIKNMVSKGKEKLSP